MDAGHFATPIDVTWNREHQFYEAVRQGTNAPVGIGDDTHEAVEHLRAERKAET